MNNQEIQFCTLQPEDSKQIQTIIVQANRNHFPLLIHKQQTLQAFQQNTRKHIKNSFEAQKLYTQILNKPLNYIFGMKMNGSLIAAMLSIDMVEQFKLMKPFFGKDSYYNMFQHLQISNLSVGSTIYFTRLSVLPQMMGKGIAKKLIYQSAKYLLGHGYKQSIVGSIVQPSFKLFMGLGGQVLMYRQVIKPTFISNIYIINNDFKKIAQSVQTNK